MARIIGLTGGIASGKTTASNILKELGAVVIDADKIAREVVEKGSPALREIERCFGTEILLKSGELDRKKLANIVFNDAELLKTLNMIIHPYIIEEVIDKINCYKKTYRDRIIILDAALLIEENLMHLVEEVWLIVTSEEEQLNRLIERDGISMGDARKRIDAQMPLEHKKKYAHKIIDNSEDFIYLRAQINENWKEIIK